MAGRTARGPAVKPRPIAEVRAALIQESRRDAGGSDPGPVIIARVDDPAKLLAGSALHKGVVDVLVDLVVELLASEADP